MRVVAVIALLLLLAGCTPTPPVPAPPVVQQLEIIEESQGWVQVQVKGISSPGYTILWGDSDTAYGRTSVVPGQEMYVHFYQAVEGVPSGEQIPTQYDIMLLKPGGTAIDQKSVLISASDCHLELLNVSGREITVEYWGRFGIEYSISWGDKFADHVMVSMQDARGTATHTYGAPGIYSVGMEEIWAPRHVFFSVTIE